MNVHLYVCMIRMNQPPFRFTVSVHRFGSVRFFSVLFSSLLFPAERENRDKTNTKNTQFVRPTSECSFFGATGRYGPCPARDSLSPFPCRDRTPILVHAWYKLTVIRCCHQVKSSRQGKAGLLATVAMDKFWLGHTRLCMYFGVARLNMQVIYGTCSAGPFLS